MAMENQFIHDDDVVSEINMTPLIDVVLVLLIIFILTVPVLTHTVELNLPNAPSEARSIEPQTIVLSIAQNGTIHWNDSALNDAELYHRLQKAAAEHPQPAIHIRGDRNADFEHVIKTVAATQRAGIVKLGLVTDPDE